MQDYKSGKGAHSARDIDREFRLQIPLYVLALRDLVGIEPLGDDDFYGQSYFVDPRGQFVGDVGDAYKPELIVRDLDLDRIREVRDTWAFYRDRRPETYEGLTKA